MPHPPYAHGVQPNFVKDASLEYLQAQLSGNKTPLSLRNPRLDPRAREAPMQRHGSTPRQGKEKEAASNDTHFVPLRQSLNSSESCKAVAVNHNHKPGSKVLARRPSVDSSSDCSHKGSASVPSGRPSIVAGTSPPLPTRIADPSWSPMPRPLLREGPGRPNCGYPTSVSPMRREGVSVSPFVRTPCQSPCRATVIQRPAPPSPRAIEKLLNVPLVDLRMAASKEPSVADGDALTPQWRRVPPAWSVTPTPVRSASRVRVEPSFSPSAPSRGVVSIAAADAAAQRQVPTREPLRRPTPTTTSAPVIRSVSPAPAPVLTPGLGLQLPVGVRLLRAPLPSTTSAATTPPRSPVTTWPPRLALWPNAKASWEHPAPSTAAPGSECSVIHSTGPEDAVPDKAKAFEPQVVSEVLAAPAPEESQDFGRPEALAHAAQAGQGAVASGSEGPLQARIPSPLPVSALREGSDAQGWWQILAETRAQRRELEHRGELALAAQEVA
ncbi:Gamt [Symbiodinium sp. CCMP2592]|nr:Gamt [Symbiodinium sp. CCMP2592]